MRKKYILLSVILLMLVAHPVSAQLDNPSKGLFVDFSGSGGNDFNSVAIRIIGIALGLIGTISLVFVIYGGFIYMTAGSNAAQALQGRKTVTNSIIGLIIAILSYIIVTVVVNSLYS